MKKIFVVIIVLAVITGTSLVWSQVGPMGPGGPGGAGRARMMFTCPSMAVIPPPSASLDRLKTVLSLSNTQVSKLKSVMTSSEKAMQPLQTKSASATKALREALYASKYDAKKVKSLAITAEKAETVVTNARIDEWTKIRSILTASQIQKLQQGGGMMIPGGGQGGMMRGGGQGGRQFGPPSPK